jgi:hypothetical protein
MGARRIIAGVAGASMMLAATTAHAEPSAADRALATALFEEGRALVRDGRVAEACPKLVESQRLDPGVGTLLNVANCHELEGKTATAWTDFHEALAIAEREGQSERAAFAREHIAALRPLLATVVLSLRAEDEGVELDIQRDGTSVARVVVGTSMPLDPGAHRIDVRGAGIEPWSVSFDIAAGERRDIVVGPLVRRAAPSSTSTSAPPNVVVAPPIAAEPRGDRSSFPRTLGYVVAGAGIVSLGIGTVFGVSALSKSSRSDELCARRCNDEGYDLNHEAKTAADISTATLITGAVALGVGIVLLVTHPTERGSYFW